MYVRTSSKELHREYPALVTVAFREYQDGQSFAYVSDCGDIAPDSFELRKEEFEETYQRLPVAGDTLQVIFLLDGNAKSVTAPMCEVARNFLLASYLRHGKRVPSFKWKDCENQWGTENDNVLNALFDDLYDTVEEGAGFFPAAQNQGQYTILVTSV